MSFWENDYVKMLLELPQQIIFIGDSEENTKGIDNVDFIDVRNFMQSEKIIHYKKYFKPYNTGFIFYGCGI